MLALILSLIFAIVLVVSATALKATGLVESRFPLAFCVAALSIIGLLQHGDKATVLGLFDAILLPYAALAIALLMLFLLQAVYVLYGCWRGAQSRLERHRREDYWREKNRGCGSGRGTRERSACRSVDRQTRE